MGVYQRPPRDSHPHDCSVMSYRGHTVLRTLIRCHFSPAETTGSQYIYSGSADGVVHVRFIRFHSKTPPLTPQCPDMVSGRSPCSKDRLAKVAAHYVFALLARARARFVRGAWADGAERRARCIVASSTACPYVLCVGRSDQEEPCFSA